MNDKTPKTNHTRSIIWVCIAVFLAVIIYPYFNSGDQPQELANVSTEDSGGSQSIQSRTAQTSGRASMRASLNSNTLPSIEGDEESDSMDPAPLVTIEAVSMSKEILAGKSVTITLQADAPAEIRDLSFTIIDDPVEGAVSQPVNLYSSPPTAERRATVLYKPADGFTGTDGFAYEVCDRDVPENCSVAAVTVAVGEPAPVARNLALKTNINEPVKIDVARLAKQVTIVDLPQNGTLLDQSGGLVQAGQTVSGTLLYSPNTGSTESEILRYQITKNGEQHLAEIQISISGIDTCTMNGREENCAS